MAIIRLSKTFGFEASHVLPRHEGKCSRLHGHSWQLRVEVEGLVDEKTGFVVDFGLLGDLVKREIIDRVDHQHLGQGCLWHEPDRSGTALGYTAVFGSEFYPTSENLLVKFAEILKLPIACLPNNPRLSALELNETCTSAALLQV